MERTEIREHPRTYKDDAANFSGGKSIVNSVGFAYKEQGAKPITNRRATSDNVGKSKSIDYIRVSYVGHVTFLIQIDGLNILTDPVWSERVSPFTFAGPKRVVKPGINFIDLPKIDVILINHNHYDHLDIRTIKDLWVRDKPKIITPLMNDINNQKTYYRCRNYYLRVGESHIKNKKYS
ncbi:hypothetical protein RAS_12550 [Rickettsia asiatica]|uniref:Metallo-beta-lactamase domain-containing protein n=1 Tax=Rickettsia asiatica TaxID=238800 RepID=A0A510G8P2_9RICK|nr:hypothetical protein RAS_12550 [Rickettsia asiatica]